MDCECRALEIFRTTGRSISSLQTARKAVLPFELKTFALVPRDRSVLHANIAARFDAMLAAGLIIEVEGLRKRYALEATLPSMRCVGYRQVWDYLEGSFDRAALREKGIAATRQLAKRQLTWLRSMQGLERLDCLRPDLANAAAERVARFLESQSSP